jgi:hypothetical protein
MSKRPLPLHMLFLLVLIPFSGALAHTLNMALEKAPAGNVIWFYGKMGVSHIIPYGLDHILFVTGLCLLGTSFRTLFLQATTFTVAHSLTLALSMKGVIHLSPQIVEPVIALSILFIAIENLLISALKPWRLMVIFLFGMIHGLGFAGALNEVGLPPGKFYLSLISFNIGVEIGQLIIMTLVFFLLIRPFSKAPGYRKRIVFPLSISLAVVAGYWVFERIFLV